MKIKVTVDIELSPRAKRLLLVGLSMGVLVVGGAVAFANVPNTFKDGDTLSAATMNDNFAALDGRLTAVEALHIERARVSGIVPSRVEIGDGSSCGLSVLRDGRRISNGGVGTIDREIVISKSGDEDWHALVAA